MLSLTTRSVRTLTHRREFLKASFLSCQGSQELLDHVKTCTPNGVAGAETRVSKLENQISEQSRENTQNLYRICAGVTMFESSDSDPSAVDHGRILGIRIEAFSQRLYPHFVAQIFTRRLTKLALISRNPHFWAALLHSHESSRSFLRIATYSPSYCSLQHTSPLPDRKVYAI